MRYLLHKAFLSVLPGLMALGLCFVSTATATPTAKIPEGEELISQKKGLPSARMGGPNDSAGSMAVLAVEGMPFADAWRVSVKERQITDRQVQLVVPVHGAIQKGDVLFLQFYARLASTQDETGMAVTAVLVELNKDPHTKVLPVFPWSVGREWKQIQIPFVANDSLPQSSGVISFRLGGAIQTLDIGGLSLLRLPKGTSIKTLPYTRPELYGGHEADAPWRAEAEARIRKHRMEDLVINVRDAEGNPIPDVQIAVEQRSQAFRFGTAVNAGALFPDTPSKDAEVYADIVTRYFNQGTLESSHKWTSWEDKKRRARAIKVVDWLRGNGLTIRGHVLLWPSWRRTPESIRSLESDPEKLRERIAAHFADILESTRGIVSDWDVINEPQTHNDLLKLLGYDYVIEAFQNAQKLDPKARLFLNEALNFNSVDLLRTFEKQALDWRSRGAPIDGLGIQAHYSGWSLTPPEKIWEELDRLAAHGFALQVTEFDIDTTDEDLQARYLRDFYTAVFAHPAVDTIQMWGFWESSHWRPPAALWRKDWSVKPAGQAYIDLVETQWKTRATLHTDSEGRASIRAFLGDYDLILTRGDEVRAIPLHLEKSTPPLEVTWK